MRKRAIEDGNSAVRKDCSIVFCCEKHTFGRKSKKEVKLTLSPGELDWPKDFETASYCKNSVPEFNHCSFISFL